MKAKASQGGGIIKGLIMKHVEKAVVAGAVLLSVYLVFKASKLGGDFELQPDALKTASVEAEQAIKEPKEPPPSEVPPWKEIAEGIRQEVPAWPYPVKYRWMQPLFPGETLRSQPEVFPLEELRASSGFGGIQMSGAGGVSGAGGMMSAPAYEEASDYGGEGYGGGAGSAKGFRWVVLSGLLPYKKQWMEYGNVFRNAELKAPQRDVPQYIHYHVERAKVTPGIEPKPEDWERILVRRELARQAEWSGSRPEIIHRKFLHPRKGLTPMAFPLPPVVDKTFGAEIAHEPQIPLYYEPERLEAPEEIDWEAVEDDPSALAGRRMGGMGGYGGYSSGGYEESGYMEQDYGASYGYGGGSGGYEESSDYMDEYAGGSMGGGSMGSGYGGYAPMGRPREVPEYQLFRFFDFTVEPGSYYRYRVRLRLANPNHEMPIQHLEDEALAEAEYIETTASNETKTIRVPLESRPLVGNVSPQLNVNFPPRAELGTVYFDEENGEETAQKVDAYRGQLLNYLGVEIEEEEPAASPYGYGAEGSMDYEEYGMEYGSGAPPSSRGSRRGDEEEEPEVIDFVTEMLVLDLLGGSSLLGRDRSLKVPGRVLLMDPAGNLVVQRELEDQEDWIEFFPPKVEREPTPEDYYGEEGSYGSYEEY